MAHPRGPELFQNQRTEPPFGHISARPRASRSEVIARETGGSGSVTIFSSTDCGLRVASGLFPVFRTRYSTRANEAKNNRKVMGGALSSCPFIGGNG